MKKLMGILLLGMFFISLGSSFEFDNVKSYDEKVKVVTITNAFGTGDVIGQSKLLSKQGETLGAGYQNVSMFELWAYQDYEDALKQFVLIDMETKKEIDREFDLKILTYKAEEIEDYDYDCYFDYSEDENGVEYCNSTFLGTHIEYKEVWTDLVSSDIDKNEKITVGVFTEVKSGDYIDWIPTIYGVEIDEWATWTEALNTDLVLYYKLDEITGTTAEDAHSTNDGTASYTRVFTTEETGIINTAADLHLDDYIDTGWDGISTTDEFTLHAWVNASTGGNGRVLSSEDSSSNGIHMQVDENGHLYGFIRKDPSNYLYKYTTSVDLHGAGWKHIAFTYDGSDTLAGMKLYVDGTEITTVTSGGSISGSSTSSNNWYIGRKGGGAYNYYNGFVDEVAIWERELTSGEVTALWNGGNGLPYATPSADNSPTATLNTPVDTTNLTTSSVDFNCSAYDDVNLVNVSLMIDGVVDQTNTSGINNTNYIFTKTGLTNGNYNWSCQAYDNNSQSTTPTARDFNISLIKPTVTLNTPVDTANLTAPSVDFNCLAYDDVSLTNVSLVINGAVDQTNSSGFNNTNYTFTKTGFSDGDYNWSCQAWDNEGGVTTPTARDFNIAIPPIPIVTLNSPADDSTQELTTDFNCSSSVSATAHLTNVSLWTNASGSWESAFIHNLVGNITDTSTFTPTENQSTVATQNESEYISVKNFTINSRVQNVTGNIWTSAGDTYVNVTYVYDDGTEFSESKTTGLGSPAPYVSDGVNSSKFVSYIRLYLKHANQDGWSYENGTVINTIDSLEVFESDIADITLWNCYACANNSNCNFSSTNYTVYKDVASPSLSLTSLNETYNYNKLDDTRYLNWTVNDTYLDTCWYDYNNTNTTVTCGDNTTLLTLKTGANSLTFYVNDSSGNLNSSTTTWGYRVWENSRTYDASVLIGASTDFEINIAANASLTNVTLIYNNTLYDAIGGPTYITSLIPTSEGSMSFYWNFTYAGQEFSSESNSQTVGSLGIDDCSSYSNEMFTFTMVDEDTLEEINGTIEFQINLYTVGDDTIIDSYNASYTYTIGEDSKVCYNNLVGNYDMSYQIRHYGNSSDYLKKYRNVQLLTINSTDFPQNLTLYNLEADRGFSFNAIVVGNILYAQGGTGLLVDVQRQYLAYDQFVSVESAITNSEDTAVVNLVEDDEIYNFIVSYNGEVIGTFNNYQVKCANSGIGQCSITLNLAIATGVRKDFEDYGNITQLFLLDTDTNILHHTFSSTDGSSKSIRSLVLKDDGFGNETICNNTASGLSGTILCTIPPQYQNMSIFIQTFESEEYLGSKFLSQGPVIDWKGADILIMLLMFSSLVLLFVGHPVTIVIGAIVGLVMPVILISVATATFTTMIGSALYYIAGGIIILIVMKRKKY